MHSGAKCAKWYRGANRLKTEAPLCLRLVKTSGKRSCHVPHGPLANGQPLPGRLISFLRFDLNAHSCDQQAA
jgi:hypothetical protein